MWLVFVQIGDCKWAARTPNGELAFGESQGLYEWGRNRVTGALQRTDYSDGDRQCSSDGRRWLYGSPAASTHEIKRRGWQAAFRSAMKGN